MSVVSGERTLTAAAQAAVRELWPCMNARALRSAHRDWVLVWPRWIYAYLLSREARLPRQDVMDAVGWRSRHSLDHAMNSLADEVETNRKRKAELDGAVRAFRGMMREGL